MIAGGRTGLILPPILHALPHSPVPAEDSALRVVSAVESGREPGRGEPGLTELGTPPRMSRTATRVISFRAYWYEFLSWRPVSF